MLENEWDSCKECMIYGIVMIASTTVGLRGRRLFFRVVYDNRYAKYHNWVDHLCTKRRYSKRVVSVEAVSVL